MLDQIVYIKVTNFLWRNSIACVLYGETQKIVNLATCSLTASWRYVGMLEQYYRSSNIISDWGSPSFSLRVNSTQYDWTLIYQYLI